MTLREALQENWQHRSEKEKMTIAVLAALLLCGFFYLFVIDPMVQWQDTQRRQLTSHSRVLPQVERLVELYKEQGQSSSQEQQGLVGIINQSLRQHGLAMKGFQPGKNNDARLSLSNVEYKPLLKWLYDIEYKHYLTIEEFSLIQTKTPGLLNATIRVRQ